MSKQHLEDLSINHKLSMSQEATTTTPSSHPPSSLHELRRALFTFHRYHALSILDNDQVIALQQARNAITTASVDVLSTRFLLEDNNEFRSAFHPDDNDII